ncbi:hypothetical protein NDU88_001046 [Pleurodeles waltl]|uniref:Uncharacterized protein n=1 Tax=Pleurodeles waltl TaxID=8319 RepID=A0AAV7KQG3_PLEWA|nr:hypothetical protein NDU88_001046 [Pleurodeles waltl]
MECGRLPSFTKDSEHLTIRASQREMVKEGQETEYRPSDISRLFVLSSPEVNLDFDSVRYFGLTGSWELTPEKRFR